MPIKFSNNFGTTLASSISSGATSFSVASASGFPSLGGSDYVYVTIDSEVVKVTATSGTTFTCDATSGGHSAGDTVEIRVTAEMLEDFARESEQYVHPNHSGEVTSTADGATVIADNVVDEANLKVSNSPTNGYVLTAQSGNAGGLTWAADTDTVYTHPDHTGEVTSTADGATVIADNVVDEANLKVSNTPTNGYFLSAQSGNTGGMTWAEVDALPSQTSNSGKYLTTDGTNASWAVLDTDANTTTKGLYEHAHTISSNYTISSGNNAFSAGDITINSGVSVTIPSSSQWVIT